LDRNFGALGSRFGITAGDARDCLQALRYDSRISLYDHATKVEKLAQIAYGDLNKSDQQKLTLKAFMRSLNDWELHRHLLAARVETMEDAVQHVRWYFQVANPQWQVIRLKTEKSHKVAVRADEFVIAQVPADGFSTASLSSHCITWLRAAGLNV